MNRFVMEDQIQSCWNTKDDLEVLLNHMDENEASTDEIQNALIGLVQLHEMRCQRLWSTFNELVKNNTITNKGVESDII